MKHTVETAKQYFSYNGCALLEKTYKNSSTPMSYRCKCGDTATITYSDFRRGRRCRSCGNKKATKTRHEKQSDEDIRLFLKKSGCVLLSKYSSYHEPLEYICKCGEHGKTTWFSFKLGRRCGKCSKLRKLKYEIEEVQKIFQSEGCELLQDTYEGVSVPVKYRCSCGTISMISLGNFKKGSRCKQCGLEKNIGQRNHRWIKDRNEKKYNDLFRKRCSKMLRRCLRQLDESKTDRTHKLLGYSHKELQKHITNHPNWHNVKNSKWDIDHIFPLTAFLDHGISDLKIINQLDNLQPLLKFENCMKSGKYNKAEFRKWLKHHL